MMPILFLSVVVRTFYIHYFERYILFILQFLGDTFKILFGRLHAHGLYLLFKLIFMTLSIYMCAVCS